MFDSKVDITKTYGVSTIKWKAPPASGAVKTVRVIAPTSTYKVGKKNKNTTKVIDSSRIWHEYQELRQTKEFKQWWWDQRHRQFGLCYYCLVDLDDVFINVEHVNPMSAGGTNDYSNLVLACHPCNEKKGSKPLSKAEKRRLKQQMAEVAEKVDVLQNYLFLMTSKELFYSLASRWSYEKIASEANKWIT